MLYNICTSTVRLSNLKKIGLHGTVQFITICSFLKNYHTEMHGTGTVRFLSILQKISYDISHELIWTAWKFDSILLFREQS